MPVSPKQHAVLCEVTVEKPPEKPRLTLRDLLDPRKLAEFMGWPFEEEKYPTTAERMMALHLELAEEWASSPHNQFKQPRTHRQYLQQCAREEKAYQNSLKKVKSSRSVKALDPVKVAIEKDKKARLRWTKGLPMPKYPSDADNKGNIPPSHRIAFIEHCVKAEFDLTCDLKTAREILCKRYPDKFFPPGQ